ncbi:MAG: hypothetical protein JNM63_02890, partial [Spirochaetia bacterium]|nr:hypothetical protein [Spirochaetia bacterium]
MLLRILLQVVQLSPRLALEPRVFPLLRYEGRAVCAEVNVKIFDQSRFSARHKSLRDLVEQAFSLNAFADRNITKIKEGCKEIDRLDKAIDSSFSHP